MSNHPLEINSLSKSFKKKQVLDNITFEVRENEIFGLIGLNGVGKTTLIKIILDLLKTDHGSATIFGRDVQIPESRANIAYLPEKFYPSQFLKGKEFLSLFLSYYNKPYNQQICTELALQLELDPKVLDHTIGKYSKDMGQKLGLMSVFLSEAPLLILDEPMTGLDPIARIELKELLIKYRKKNNNTIFFSSHILSDIDEICDRIAVIDSSRLVFLGTPAELKEKYQSETLEYAFIKSIRNREEA